MATSRTRKCRDKVKRGNVFRCKEFAESCVQSNERRLNGIKGLHAYRCGVCGHWHVGRPRREAEPQLTAPAKGGGAMP